MLPEYKKKTNIGIGLGIIISLVCAFLITLENEEVANDLGGAIYPLSPLFFIYGLCCYAKGKGYHGAWGLLGLFTLVGLIILACFPDRHKSIRERQKTNKKNK